MTRTKMILMAIYIIGVICVCAILGEMLIGGNKVIFMYWSGVMAIGYINMLFHFY